MIAIQNKYLNYINDQADLIESIKKMRFTVKTSYQIALVFEKIIPYVKAFIDAKQVLVNKYGSKDASGQLVINKENSTIQLDDPESFIKDFNSLLDVETHINMDKIIFDTDKEPNLTVNEINVLMPFIQLK